MREIVRSAADGTRTSRGAGAARAPAPRDASRSGRQATAVRRVEHVHVVAVLGRQPDLVALARRRLGVDAGDEDDLVVAVLLDAGVHEGVGPELLDELDGRGDA